MSRGGEALVLFTAHQELSFPDFQRHGFTAFVVKPFDLEALLATSATILRG